MALQRIDPAGLAQPVGYSQVVVASGSRIVFVAGQVAIDGQNNLVGAGDVVAQARQAFGNLKAALAGAGATPADVAKMTWFIVNYSADMLPALAGARREVLGDVRPASTLLGVQALAAPGYLIEVEAIAVLA
jgi:enamine deaminase RidA (YjgF/YER057c/UK114 family)